MPQFGSCLITLIVAITPCLALAAPTRHGTEQVVDPQPELTLPSVKITGQCVNVVAERGW
jgi:hypothetical protein